MRIAEVNGYVRGDRESLVVSVERHEILEAMSGLKLYGMRASFEDARAAGETEQRLYMLSAWREAPFYSARERATLEWTEAVTLMSQGPIADELYETVRQHFTEKEIVDLTLAVIAINSWNRLAIPFQTPAGSYRLAPGVPETAAS